MPGTSSTSGRAPCAPADLLPQREDPLCDVRANYLRKLQHRFRRLRRPRPMSRSPSDIREQLLPRRETSLQDLPSYVLPQPRVHIGRILFAQCPVLLRR